MKVPPSSTFPNSVSRPFTAYNFNKNTYRNKFVRTYGSIASANHSRIKQNSVDLRMTNPITIESANTMREISKFEKMHGLEKVRKISNKYPKKNLVSNQAMEKRYFSGHHIKQPSEFLNALELE